MESNLRSHIDHLRIFYHSIDESISISSSVHQQPRISNIEPSRVDRAIHTIDHEPAIIDHSQCRIERIVLSAFFDRQSSTDRSMAAEHRWRIDVVKHCRSHIDHLHHSIDHLDHESISISSSVHQCRWLSNIECSRVDRAICLNGSHSTIIDHSQCRIERIVLGVGDDRQSSTDRSMAAEYRWSDIMESNLRSHIDHLHHSIDHSIDGSISISSSVHQCR